MIINKFTEENKRIQNDVSKEIIVRDSNTSLFNQLNESSQIFDNVQDKSSEWEYMNEFVDSEGDTTFLYKQWDIELITYDVAEKQKYIELITPYINYNVLYKEPTAMDIKMYSTGLELNHVAFIDAQDTSLHLKVSAYIKKYFGSSDLINPEVKLNVSLRNTLKILH